MWTARGNLLHDQQEGCGFLQVEVTGCSFAGVAERLSRASACSDFPTASGLVLDEHAFLLLSENVASGRRSAVGRGGLRLTQVAIQHFGYRIGGRTGPPNPPPGQDYALICDSQRPMDELFDQEDRDTGVSHLLHTLEDGVDDDRCKAERHLVCNEQLRLDRKRSAQRKHLLLSSGEATRSLVSSAPKDWEQLDGSRDSGLSFSASSSTAGGHPQVVDH